MTGGGVGVGSEPASSSMMLTVVIAGPPSIAPFALLRVTVNVHGFGSLFSGPPSVCSLSVTVIVLVVSPGLKVRSLSTAV
jgi:hypothetical protein